MKIAVALFGIPRASDQALPTLLHTALRSVRELGHVKVFYHLFHQTHIRNPRSGEDAPLPPDNYKPFEQFEGELEPADACLQRWSYEELKANGDAFGDDFQSMRNLVHQLHSLWTVTERAASWRPDVVLFLRPDLVYHDPIPAQWVVAARRNPDLVVLPDWQWWGGVNDRLAVCGRSSFAAYGRRIELAARYCEQTRRALHSERLLRFALRHAGVRLRTRPLRASRIRIDGRIVEENFDGTVKDAHWGLRQVRRVLRLLPL
jgi:hypothetical protein